MLGGNLGSLLYGDVSVMGFANDTKKPKVSGVIAFRGHLVEGGGGCLWNKYQGQHGFRHCNIQNKKITREEPGHCDYCSLQKGLIG